MSSELTYKESENAGSRTDGEDLDVGPRRESDGATCETIADEEEIDGPRAESS